MDDLDLSMRVGVIEERLVDIGTVLARIDRRLEEALHLLRLDRHSVSEGAR